MRWLLSSILVLVALIGGAILLAPQFIPSEHARAFLSAQLTNALQRPVRIDGPVTWRVVPSPSIEAGDIEVLGAGPSDPIGRIEIEAIRGSLALRPLFDGVLSLRGVHVQSPKIELARQVMVPPTAAAASAPDSSAQDALAPPAVDDAENGARSAAFEIADLGIDEVTIADGQLVLPGQRLTDIDARLELPSLDLPARLEGAALWQGQIVETELEIASPRQAMAGGKTALQAVLRLTQSHIAFDGDIDLNADPRLTGKLDAATPDLHELIAALLPAPPSIPAWNAVRITAALVAGTGRIDLGDLTFAIDDAPGTGALVLELEGERPLLSGNLTLPALDLHLNAAVPSTSSAADAAPTSNTPNNAPAEPATAAAPSNPPNPKPATATAVADADILLPLDVDLAVAWPSLMTKAISIGKARLHFKGGAESLLAIVHEMAIAGGGLTGAVTATRRNRAVFVQPDVALRSANAAPVLASAGLSGLLSGTLDVDLNVTANATDAATIRRSLTGKGRIALNAGTLQIPDRWRGDAAIALLSQAVFRGADRLLEVSGGGTFVVERGVLDNDDLLLSVPAGALKGRGQIDLGAERINRYTLQFVPLVPGTPIPALRLEGPLDSPNATIDPTALLEQPAAAANKALKQLQEGDAEGAAETFINEGIGGLLRSFGVKP